MLNYPLLYVFTLSYIMGSILCVLLAKLLAKFETYRLSYDKAFSSWDNYFIGNFPCDWALQ